MARTARLGWPPRRLVCLFSYRGGGILQGMFRPRCRVLGVFAAMSILAVSSPSPDAAADPYPSPGPVPAPGFGSPGGPNLGGQLSPDAQLSPGEAVFLCPGVGAAANVLGAGGGYCDFNFGRTLAGTGHIHCEWGGASPLISVWNCWRVFPGQPDHPAHPDPDIIPDGWGVPWAILGPTVDDQWPPPGLAPAADFAPPEQSEQPQQQPPEQPPPPPPPPEPESDPAS